MHRMNLQAPKTIVVIALGAFVLMACKPPAAAVGTEVIRPVKTMTVGDVSGQPGASFSAEIKPRVESQLAFRVGGKVVERLVEIGQRVRKNQPLMRLDPADLQLSSNAAQAQVAAAQANADVAQAALKRAQDLAKQNFISAGALDQAVGQANSANAALLAAQANGALGLNATQYGVLKADSDGVVTALSVEVGQVVAAGAPVIRMASSGVSGRDKDVVFNVPEQMLASVAQGTSLGVRLWSQPDAVLVATVRDVAAMADPLTRTYTIKATLKDSTNTARLGATATATLALGAARVAASVVPAVTIPLSAVLESQGNTSVWLVQSGAVKKQAVTLNPRAVAQDGWVVVTSGLQAGAVVVVAGVHVLADGQKVKRLLDANAR
jgi:membrane fusion protein, multidrug efflux system